MKPLAQRQRRHCTRPRKVWHHAILLALGCLLLMGPGMARPKPALEGFERRTLKHGGLERSYYLRLPPGYDGSRKHPLLLVLHGGGGSAPQALRSYPLTSLTDREGVILVAPNGTGPVARELLRTWNVGFGFGYARRHSVDDIGFLRALITQLKSELAIDASRVYLTGMSNGGILCHQMAAGNADLIRGIAPVAATAGGKAKGQPATIMPPIPSKAVDVIMFCGELDRSIPFQGGRQTQHAQEEPVEVLSAEESAMFWVKHNGCQEQPEIVNLAEQKATRKTWSGGRNGSRVVLLVLHNQGHAWPGGSRAPRRSADVPSPLVKAHEVMWDFFETQSQERGKAP